MSTRGRSTLQTARPSRKDWLDNSGPMHAITMKVSPGCFRPGPQRQVEMEIGEDHKRGITTTLRLVDKAVWVFRSWAEGRSSRSALHEERNDLTAEQRAGILAETDRMIAILVAMRNDLGLEPRLEVAAELIRIRLAAIWVHLMELNGENLRGRGEPTEDLVEYLEQNVRELLKHVDRITEIVSLKPGPNSD